MRDRNRRLYVVYQSNPFLAEQGGGVRYAQNLAYSLADKDVRLTFLGVGGSRRQEGNISFIPIMQHANSTWRFLLCLSWARFRHIGFSRAIVHVHRLYYIIPFLGPRIRCIATLHGRTFTVFPERYGRALSSIAFPLFRCLERVLISLASALVAVSDDVIEQFTERHGRVFRRRSVPVIPSMVDLSAFSPQTTGPSPGGEMPGSLCLFLGRLSRVKNLPLLLQSWVYVSGNCPTARLLIAGDGECRQEVVDQVSSLGLEASVDLLGQIASDAVPSLMASAHLLVLTSDHEASPTVVKEALACGLPVVSTRVGDVEKVVNQGVTGLTPHADARSIANAIVEVLGWRRSREEIAQVAAPVLAHYSPSVMAPRYLAIYTALGLHSHLPSQREER